MQMIQENSIFFSKELESSIADTAFLVDLADSFDYSLDADRPLGSRYPYTFDILRSNPLCLHAA